MEELEKWVEGLTKDVKSENVRSEAIQKLKEILLGSFSQEELTKIEISKVAKELIKLQTSKNEN